MTNTKLVYPVRGNGDLVLRVTALLPDNPILTKLSERIECATRLDIPQLWLSASQRVTIWRDPDGRVVFEVHEKTAPAQPEDL